MTKWTGVEVRALRTAALRVSQPEFAEIIGFTVAAVRKWETRRETIELSGRYAAAMDTMLDRLTDSERARFEAALMPGPRSASMRTVADTFENPTDIAQRVQALTEIDTDDNVLDILMLAVDDVVHRYEFEGPRRLAPEVITARHQVEAMLGQRRHPAQLRALYSIAGRLSGVLGYMAVNRGRFGHARMYCREAFAIGQLLGDTDLQAWVKGTESFCAYYQGDYAAAVRAAYEGLDLADGGPQSIRLYSNGLARALGKVGDSTGVAAAIAAATTTASALDTGPGLTPALTFAPYGEARIMANAATAFLSAGEYERCLGYGQQVEDRVADSDSVWSRSLVRLDMAAAMLGAGCRDVERAAYLGVEALNTSSDRPIRSVWQRAHELGAIIGAIRARGSDEYLGSLRAWSSSAREFSAPEG
ncbi:helix-turn-helix domain-containing protein [Nocardia sp. SC052]|uniref:helix-turn-helix domain-containing protein n=1 Tax=Nocardia sichangensis TaxID=3385975 RepID=UPI0039A1D2C6